MKVLEKIDAAIEGARVITPDTSEANLQEAFCGKGLIDMDVQEARVTHKLNIMHSTQEVGTGLDMGSSMLGFKLGSKPTEVSKQKRANKSSCKGNNSGKVITKTPYVGEDNSPSKGKSKQGRWKRKDGRPVEGSLSYCMDIDVGQKRKKVTDILDGPESGMKRGKTSVMIETISLAEVARQPC